MRPPWPPTQTENGLDQMDGLAFSYKQRQQGDGRHFQSSLGFIFRQFLRNILVVHER